VEKCPHNTGVAEYICRIPVDRPVGIFFYNYSYAGVVALTFYFWKNRMPRMPNYLAALAASEHKEDLK